LGKRVLHLGSLREGDFSVRGHADVGFECAVETLLLSVGHDIDTAGGTERFSRDARWVQSYLALETTFLSLRTATVPPPGCKD
jgi:hypothetical protein